MWYWELNFDPLKEQQVFLTAEPSHLLSFEVDRFSIYVSLVIYFFSCNWSYTFLKKREKTKRKAHFKGEAKLSVVAQEARADWSLYRVSVRTASYTHREALSPKNGGGEGGKMRLTW